MAKKDIRWIQRYSNFAKALGQLSRFIKKKEMISFQKITSLENSALYNREILIYAL